YILTDVRSIFKQKKIKLVGRGPHHQPFPEFAEKLVSRPNLVQFLKNFTACTSTACSLPWNRKKLNWWAGGPITSRFRNSRKSLYLSQILSTSLKISHHTSSSHCQYT